MNRGPSPQLDLTTQPFRAVLSMSQSPGITGLHSVRGEGWAFARRVEKHDDYTKCGSAKFGQNHKVW